MVTSGRSSTSLSMRRRSSFRPTKLVNVGGNLRRARAPAADAALTGSPRPSLRSQRGVVSDDRPLQFAELLTGFEAELLTEQGAGPLERPQRLGLTAVAVEGQHQLGPTLLPKRFCGGGCVEIGDQRGVTSQVQARLVEVLDHGAEELFQPGAGRSRRAISEVRRRRAAPEASRRGQRLDRLIGVARRPAPDVRRRRGPRTPGRPLDLPRGGSRRPPVRPPTLARARRIRDTRLCNVFRADRGGRSPHTAIMRASTDAPCGTRNARSSTMPVACSSQAAADRRRRPAAPVRRSPPIREYVAAGRRGCAGRNCGATETQPDERTVSGYPADGTDLASGQRRPTLQIP